MAISRRFGGLIVWALAASCATFAHGQTASQVVPDYRPVAPMQGGGLSVLDGEGFTAPAGADELKVKVGKVIVEGGLPTMASRTAAILSPLEGRTVTAADIFKAAQALEAAYAGEGYVLARAVLPAQNITEGGDLRLIVIDGRIEAVDVSALPPRIRPRVEALLKPLVGIRGLKLSRIERQILLASDTPGASLRSVLKRGVTPGGGVLVIEAQYQDHTVGFPDPVF